MPDRDDPQPTTPAPSSSIAAQTVDASRRTHLANERTILAWWRTGLAALAVGLGAGKLVPALTDVTRWPYALLGAGFSLLGVGFIAYGLMRERLVEQALGEGRFASADERILAAFAAAGILLGAILLILVTVG